MNDQALSILKQELDRALGVPADFRDNELQPPHQIGMRGWNLN